MNPRIALVGPGYWGKNLLRNLKELGVLHGICESNLSNPVLKQFQDVALFENFDTMVTDPSIDAVAIATPAVMHFPMAKKAILAGKDVFVEKPLALTVPEAEELVALATHHKRILMVGHILQYHPAVMKLRELIVKGDLGKIQYVYSNRLNIGKLRTEENILWSFAPHDISVILMLLGETPRQVACNGGDYLSPGIVDTTVTTLGFDNGVKAHIFVSWLHPFKEQKLVVVGSKAMAVFDDVSAEKLFLYPHTIDWSGGKVPIAQKAEHQVVSFEKDEPLKAELRHFLECVTARHEPRTGGAEGVSVLKVLEASETSMAKGGLPVHLGSRAAARAAALFVHETAAVDEGVKIGDGTKIWHFSHILKNVVLGERCVVGQNVTIGPDVTIGNCCKIQNNVSVYKGVTLEDEVFCGPSCVFTNVYNPRAFIERKNEFLPTLVKRGATIGANSTIVCGSTIGRYAMVAAGAVVKKDVLDHAVVAGVPARQVGWACRCGMTLRFSKDAATCASCGEGYLKTEDGLRLVHEKGE